MTLCSPPSAIRSTPPIPARSAFGARRGAWLLAALLPIALCFAGGPARAQQAPARALPIGANEPAPASYRDLPDDHWAAEAVQLLTELGIFTGYPDANFRGTDPATRFELAVVAARLVGLLGDTLPAAVTDPVLRERLERAAAGLGVEPRSGARLQRLEAGLDEAASVAYARQLERRIVDLEAEVNRLVGATVLPRAGADAAVVQRASEALPAEGARERPGVAAGGVLGTTAGAGANATDSAAAARDDDRFWFALAFGAPLGGTLWFGVEDMLAPVDLRAGLSATAAGEFGLSLEALFELPIRFGTLPAEVYLAAGPTLLADLAGGVDSATGELRTLLGVQYRLGPDGSEPGALFVEVGPSLRFLPADGTGVVMQAGFAYRF